MKKNHFFIALLFACIFAINGVKVQEAFGWGANGGDGSDYRQLQETAIFFNNSGATLVAGDVVILDVGGQGVATDTTLGSYVTTTQHNNTPRALADNVLAIGVVESESVADQRPVVVVTRGPALTTVDDSSDAVSNFTAVGTSGVTTERAGGGTNLGIALEPGSGSDADQIIIWVDPTGAD